MNTVRRKQLVKAIIALLVGGLYLLNPTGGIIEFLPDVLPIVGNLDEATATALVIYGLRELRSTPPVISIN